MTRDPFVHARRDARAPSIRPPRSPRSTRRAPGARGVLALAFCAVALAGAGGCTKHGGSTGPTHLSTSPGTPNGAPASATIGAAGGALTSSDGGLVVTLPPGAVASDTVFTVTPVTGPASNAIATYRLEPEGTTFAVPARLTFAASNAGVKHAGLAFLGIALHEDAGTWRLFEHVVKDATAKTVSVEVSHFSEYSMLSGYQFQPVATTAEVGGAAEFTVVACADPVMLAMINGEVPEDLPVDLPDPLVYECQPVYFAGAHADQWSVEGVQGGDGTHGTIHANGDVAAVFEAPQEKPDPATVSVSAWFTYAGFQSLQDMLVGRVTITDDEKYFGAFTVQASGPVGNWTATGNATWRASSTPYEYIVSGSVKMDQTVFYVGNGMCTLITAEQPFTYDAGSILETPAPATIFWAIGPLAWAARCCDSGGGNCQDVPYFITLTWSSGCGGDWATLDAAALEAHGDLAGSYTWPTPPCGIVAPGVPTAKVDWYFYSYATPP